MSSGPPFALVFFDCDSTLSAIEGIDELARRAGMLEAIAPLTRAAMEGHLTLEEIYQKRLELIRPDAAAIAWLGERYVAELVEGARETVATLHALGKHVHILSGGIRQAVLTLGQALAIPEARIHAVGLSFDAAGAYAGFDELSPLARSGGKARVCQQVLANGQLAALVGDGITDLETVSAGVFVVGFGGVARREAVARAAHLFVDGPSLLTVLDVLLTQDEQVRCLSAIKKGGLAAPDES
jgi:phosphoserine phosphatase